MPIFLDSNTGILIKKAARLFEQVGNKDVASLGATYAQSIFLCRLWEKDGQTQMELTKSSGCKQPSVVRILDRMEKEGLITRKRNKIDRRVFNFFLTEKAKIACQDLQFYASSRDQSATAGISAQEKEQLNKSLLIIIKNLQEQLLS